MNITNNEEKFMSIGNFNWGYGNQPSLIGTLVFPGRQSCLPASTVPEYPAQAYPVMNYPGSDYFNSTYDVGTAIEHDYFNKFPRGCYGTSSPFGSPFTGLSSGSSFSNPYSSLSSGLAFTNPLAGLYSDNSYNFTNSSFNNYAFNPVSCQNNSPIGSSIINQILNFINISNNVDVDVDIDETEKTETTKTTAKTDTTAKTNTDDDDDDSVDSLIGLLSDFLKGFKSGSTSNVAQTNVNINNFLSQGSAGAVPNDITSITNPLPLSDPYGNALPVNYAAIQYGLFGNVHGVDSIIARYVADIMPTDKNSPGYTWKYTIPGG